MQFIRKPFYQIFTLISFVTITSCSQKKAENTKEGIILEIGGVKLTRQEWAMQLKKNAAMYQQRYQSPIPTDSIKKNAEEFIDYAYVLAGAYDKKYSEKPEVTEKVLETSKYMMAQKNGELYKKTIASKVAITDADITNAIDKSKKRITLSVLQFRDKQAMLAVLGKDTVLSNGTAFYQAAAKCKGSNQARASLTIPLTIPSQQYLLLQDKIWEMPTGQISAPIYSSDGPYNTAVYIIYKEKVLDMPGATSNDREKLKAALQYMAEEKLYLQFVQNKLKESAYTLDTDLLTKIAQKATYSEKVILEENSVSDLLSKKLMSYRVKGNVKTYTVSDFLEYYNTKLPIRQKMNAPAQYESFLKGIIINDLAYNDAVELGLTNEPKFADSQHNFKNRTIAESFKTNELFKSITIQESTIQEEYAKNKAIFQRPEAVEVSIFKFHDMQEAGFSMRGLQQLATFDSKTLTGNPLIKGLKDYTLHTQIRYSDNTYDKRMISQLFSMPDKTVTRPFTVGGMVLVFKKEKSAGMRTKSFEEVTEQIKTMVEKKQESKLLQEYLASAKKKYVLKSHFKEEDYILPAEENLNAKN